MAKSYESLADKVNVNVSKNVSKFSCITLKSPSSVPLKVWVSVTLLSKVSNLKNMSLVDEPDVVKVSTSNVQSLHVTYISTLSP